MKKYTKRINSKQYEILNNIAYMSKLNRKTVNELNQLLSAQVELWIMEIKTDNRYNPDINSFYEHVDTLVFMYDIVPIGNLLNL